MLITGIIQISDYFEYANDKPNVKQFVCVDHVRMTHISQVVQK